jgi:hypothetical protein
MNITIKNSKASQSIIEINDYKWKLHRKPIIRFIVFAYVLSIVAIVFGTVSRDEYSWYVSTPGSAQYINFHFAETFGYIILIFASVGVLFFSRSKKTFFAKVKGFSEQLLKSSDETLIHITESEITYSDFQLNQRMQWSLVTSYTITEPYIFLQYGTTVLGALTIDTRLLQKHELDELLAFLKSKVAHSK